MLLKWESKILNKIYKTDFSYTLTNSFTKLDHLDYKNFYQIIQSSNINSQKNQFDTNHHQQIFTIANNLIRKNNSSYDIYPEILKLNSILELKLKIRNEEIPKQNYELIDIIILSSLSKCRIWPRLYKSNMNNKILSTLIKFYQNFIEQYKEDLDFKFDPTILSIKYTKIMEKGLIKRKTNLQFLNLVQNNQYEKVQKLLITNPDILLSIQPQMQSQAPHIAAQKSSIQMINLLYKYKADFQCLDKQMQTPIFYAVKRGDINVVKFLIQIVKTRIDQVQYQNRTPIYLAAFQGNLEIVKYLYEKGADPNQASKLSRTPLSKACYLGNVDVVKFLLDIKVNVTAIDSKGRTALHNAAWGIQGGRDGKRRGQKHLQDSPQSVQLLLDYGHPIDVRDFDGFTPLFSAISSNALKSFSLLVKNGANLHNVTNRNQTACIIASKYGHLEILQMLIQNYKCDFNMRDNHNFSPIDGAAAASQQTDGLKCFQYLIGKVFSEQNKNDRTFGFTIFIQCTKLFKKQRRIFKLIEKQEYLQIYKNIIKCQDKQKLFAEVLHYKNNDLIKIVKWMIINQIINSKEYQIIINMLLKNSRYQEILQLLSFKKQQIKLLNLLEHIREESNQKILWELLQLDSDCTENLQNFSQLLNRLVSFRKTQVIISILKCNPNEQKVGVFNFNKKEKIQILTKRQNDLNIIQYCLINKLNDIGKILLEFIKQEKQDQYKFSNFSIPKYSVTQKQYPKEQLIIEQIPYRPIKSYLNQIQLKYLHYFTNLQQKHATEFIKNETHKKKYFFINKLTHLQQFIKQFQNFKLWAIDVQHYSEQHNFICTIQLSNIHTSYIIDAFILRQHMHKIRQVLQDPSYFKIFHGCQNDVRWLFQDYGFKIKNIFDTNKINMLVMNEKKSVSLKQISLKLLNIELIKDFQTADWRIRPLFTEMIQYARMDSEILIYIFFKLLKKCQQKKLLQQAIQICRKSRKMNIKNKKFFITME